MGYCFAPLAASSKNCPGISLPRCAALLIDALRCTARSLNTKASLHTNIKQDY